MEKYKARGNDIEQDIPEKSKNEQKQESTEKAVDLAAETALDYFTGGMGSTVKNAVGNVPIVGNAVNKTWDQAVKGVSKVASKTPAGNILKKADDVGVTDLARTAKDTMDFTKGKGGVQGANSAAKPSNMKGVQNNSDVANKSSRFDSLKSGINKTTSTNGDIVGNLWGKLPKGLKIKIVVGCGVCFLFMMIVFTVFAQDDIQNLSLTNNTTISGVGTSNGDLSKSLEDISNWYITDVAVYDQTLYLQSPFTTSQVRADCTGFAVAFMSYVAGVDIPISWSGEMVYPDGDWAQGVAAYGWKAYSSDEIGELQFGDVLVAHSGSLYSTKGEHAEIYVDESHTFGWGSVQTTYPKSNTITKSTFGGHVHFMDSGHDYITIYRYEGAINNTNGSSSSGSLNATNMNDSSFNHGTKPKSNQKYIMLHDTEMSVSASSVVESWKNSGSGVAAHFVVDKDGTIIQAVDLDVITHHAGPGGPGNYDEKFSVGNNDGKGNGDDLVGNPTGKGNYADYTSYGMNSYSIGIEMCHVNGETYPETQLEAVDKIIAYIDSYYGFKSTIIDHKEWRPSNSDTDANFATYLSNYKTLRHH